MKRNLFLIVALMGLLSSCAPKLVSNKAQDYTKNPKRIFIEFVYTSKKDDVSRRFAVIMASQLNQQGIEASSFVHSNLSFDTEQDIEKKASDFKADAVMYIKQSYSPDDAGNGSFNVALYDAETKKPFWKSSFELGEEDVVAGAMIKKLKQDGVIAASAK